MAVLDRMLEDLKDYTAKLDEVVDRAESFLVITDIFILANLKLYKAMSSHADVGHAQKGESDPGDVSPVLLGSKESRCPPTVKLGR
ncbi:MAG: hypothetical protein ACP5HQ_06830 [Thermoprotei archaeon]